MDWFFVAQDGLLSVGDFRRAFDHHRAVMELLLTEAELGLC